MSGEEYVSINPAQQVYGKKNLLYCEMELLNSIKRYESYQKLKKDEHTLKKALKKKIAELHEDVRKMLELIPKVKQPEYPSEKKSNTSNKRKLDLEEKIQEIKRRIAELEY